MVGLKDSFRCGDFTYHDEIFSHEINHFVRAAEAAYNGLMFREALKAGFYDLQAARDRYRDITAAGDGMNWALVERFIQVLSASAHRSCTGGIARPQRAALYVLLTLAGCLLAGLIRMPQMSAELAGISWNF